jgi:hypothetical protein
MTALDQIIAPTAERLLHANDNFVIDPSTNATKIQAPIARLKATGKINGVQAEAAERFYADYYAAGLAPLGAMDYERAIVDGTPPQGHSDYRSAASDRYRGACSSVGSAITLRVVDRVVLREIAIETVGRDISHRAHAREARAVAMDRLCEGLDCMAVFYRLVAGKK